MSGISKKVQSKLDEINARLGTEYKAVLKMVPQRPPYMDMFVETGSGEASIGKLKLWEYNTYRHRTGTLRIYGITWSKYFIGIRWGRTWLHVRSPLLHSMKAMTVYCIEGLGIHNASSKEARQKLTARLIEL